MLFFPPLPLPVNLIRSSKGVGKGVDALVMLLGRRDRS